MPLVWRGHPLPIFLPTKNLFRLGLDAAASLNPSVAFPSRVISYDLLRLKSYSLAIGGTSVWVQVIVLLLLSSMFLGK